MKIGIDAKWYFEGPPSGRMVVQNLIKSMIALNSKHQIVLFLDRRAKAANIPFLNDRIRLVYLWADNNLISNTLLLPFLGLRYKIDVLIAQYFSPLCSTFKRISFIHDISFESNPSFFTKKELLYFLPMKISARRAHKICTISLSEKRRLVQYGYNTPQNIHIVYNGVDHDRFKLRQFQKREILQAVRVKYKLPSEFLLYVGRLNIRKNIDTLLEAMSLLNNKSIPLVLAGNPDWKMADISQIISKYDLMTRVIFTGFVDDDALPALYSLASIFCYVSYDEGFGLPPLEAMASGVPVVVSDIGPHREVCGLAGCYVNPKNPQDIACRIDELLVHRDLYQKMRELGLERARLFSWENSAKSLLDCISSIS